MKILKKIEIQILCTLLTVLAACAPTAPQQDFASPNGISIKYNAYDLGPTLTLQARDMAIKHCAQYGKYANYRGARMSLGTEEIHEFTCDQTQKNEAAAPAQNSQRTNSTTSLPRFEPMQMPPPMRGGSRQATTSCRPDYIGGYICTTN